jgi:hypothetical protein
VRAVHLLDVAARKTRGLALSNRADSNVALANTRELLAMKRYAEYLEEELRKLKGPNWRPSMPRPNFVRRSSVCVCCCTDASLLIHSCARRR